MARKSAHRKLKQFVNVDDSSVSKKRTKSCKTHQKYHSFVSSRMSSKILKEALLQQKEIQNEVLEDQNPNISSSFWPVEGDTIKDDDNADDIAGFDKFQSHFGSYDDESSDEDDERLLDAFLSDDVGMADRIAEKIKEKNASFSCEVQPLLKFDNSIIDLYKGVGKILSNYTVGKMPKAFKHIPSIQHWEDVLYLTEPENWSPHATYEATRIFVSNMGVNKAERFCRLFLLPRVREDIRKNKILHPALYRALKKSLYKPTAFFKGILLPLCESKTCNLREARKIGSIIRKLSIPSKHSGAAIMKLAEMEYFGTTSYFLKLLFEKEHALPNSALDGAANKFMKFADDSREMPVIWHQSLLACVQRYKNVLRKEDKDGLRKLIEEQNHRLITPEICRELGSSRCRGEKDDDLVSRTLSVINKTIEEDRFDIPQVPMEED